MTEWSFGWRWLTGAAVGFEMNKTENIAFSVYLLIIELVLIVSQVDE